MKRHVRRGPLGLGAALVGVSMLWVLALSGSGSAAGQAAPTNTTEPRILGEARVGSTLTANRGLWTGSPTSYNYQLLVMMVRARKAGENVLGGVSTRRLVSFPVNLAA